MSFPPAVIPIPSYLLDDDELVKLEAKLQEIEVEADQPDDGRAAACVAAIRVEIAKRGRPISINDIQS